MAVNSLPFAFSKGMSCSGSYVDHTTVDGLKLAGNLILTEPEILVSGTRVFYLQNHGQNERFGIRVGEPQGYAVLRANQAHEGWQTLENMLQAIPDSALTVDSKWAREDTKDEDHTPNTSTYCYQVFLLEEHTNGDFDSLSYMSAIWSELAYKISQIPSGLN